MKKALKILGISFASVLLLLLLLPYLMPATISNGVKQWLNENINGEVQFESSGLSFFKQFPSLTLNLHELRIKGAAPFEKDTLLQAKDLSFGVDLSSLFSGRIKIDRIYLDQANIRIKVDEKGNANYNIWKQGKDTKGSGADSSSAAIKIENISIRQSKLIYHDLSVPMMVRAIGLNYTGQGDLSKAIFDLKSNAQIDTLDLYYNNNPYLLHKKVNAKLLTKINTHSLDLMFDENDLKINSLPIHFVGRFSFLKNGYDINFKTVAKETDLHNIFTALPPAMASRMEETNIKGYAEINASLVGKYQAGSKSMPTLAFNMKIRQGEINNPKAPQPIRNLFLNLQTRLPALNPDSLYINMDSLYFTMGKDHLSSVLRFKGLKEPEIFTKTRASVNLEQWAKVFGIAQLKGHLVLDLDADGKYTKKVVRSGIRRVDTVIASIPKFSLKSSLSGGYFKYSALPAAIDHINFRVEGGNPDGDYKHTHLDFRDIDIRALSNYLKGFVKFSTAQQLSLDADLKSVFNFAELKQFYPLKGLELSGMLHVDVQSRGSYNKKRKIFPVTRASIKLNEGYLKTASFNQALEHIVVDGTLFNQTGTLKGTRLQIKPVSFRMAGQPFLLKADVRNFENVAYDVKSKGTVDIGKMYQLFAIKGYQVKGSVRTDFSLKGLQSDAMAGRYDKLNNKGRMVIKGLNLQSDLFPKEFLIREGLFSFIQDKMKFEQFKASYGKSDFNINGALDHVIAYVLSEKAALRGTFDVQSKNLYADEFMAYHSGPPASSAKGKGVILIPANLNVSFSANVASLHYNGLDLQNVKGILNLDKGGLLLKDAGFNLIGAAVQMNASYKSLKATSALFDYRITAKEFDIAKAYKEVKLFRELASSASKVQGVVGLDYQLSGRLNQDMFPVLPSIKGAGVLSLKKVSLLGFKLMNAVSKATRRDTLTNPDLSEVNIKSSINKNIITIERFKMKIAGFRPRFEGQVSLDGRLNMSGRLGLPPFGLFGIPLSITGTQEKPVVRLKRNKDGKLEETADPEN